MNLNYYMSRINAANVFFFCQLNGTLPRPLDQSNVVAHDQIIFQFVDQSLKLVSMFRILVTTFGQKTKTTDYVIYNIVAIVKRVKPIFFPISVTFFDFRILQTIYDIFSQLYVNEFLVFFQDEYKLINRRILKMITNQMIK